MLRFLQQLILWQLILSKLRQKQILKQVSWYLVLLLYIRAGLQVVIKSINYFERLLPPRPRPPPPIMINDKLHFLCSAPVGFKCGTFQIYLQVAGSQMKFKKLNFFDLFKKYYLLFFQTNMHLLILVISSKLNTLRFFLLM